MRDGEYQVSKNLMQRSKTTSTDNILVPKTDSINLDDGESDLVIAKKQARLTSDIVFNYE